MESAMRRWGIGIASIVLMTTTLNSGTRADPVADFYRGKRITVMIGYATGGGFDLYARLLARHMGSHIPGQPTLVPQNFVGAGSLNAANTLYNVAARDGTVFGTFARGMAMEGLIGSDKVQFDATKFTWLGSATNELSVCATWHASPTKTWADLLSKPTTVSGTGAGADPDTFAALVKNVFGAKLKLISGYRGTGEMNLAIERGEVDGRCGWSWGVIKSTQPGWVAEKKLNVIVQLSLHKSPELPGVPLIMDFANDRQKQILKMVLSRQVMGRPFAAPPGLPDDRTQALRKAFDETLKDPVFLEDANRQGLDTDPVGGVEVEKLVNELYRTPKDVVEEARLAIIP
jgi:tripartite-type tricarboxylate transporter receptor subunit TctC